MHIILFLRCPRSTPLEALESSKSSCGAFLKKFMSSGKLNETVSVPEAMSSPRNSFFEKTGISFFDFKMCKPCVRISYSTSEVGAV